MQKAQFTETQIVKALTEYEGGRRAEDLCRGVTDFKSHALHSKSRYWGRESSDVKRLKEMEEEHSRLKRMYANLAMDNDALA